MTEAPESGMLSGASVVIVGSGLFEEGDAAGDEVVEVFAAEETVAEEG